MDYVTKYNELKSQFAERDERHAIVSAVRRGEVDEVMPGFFPKDHNKQITANMLDVAARDLGEMLGAMPQLSCQPARFTSQASMKFADKRTKIAIGYTESSRLQPQLYQGADHFFTFSALVLIVEPDFESSMPVIRVDSPVGAYYLKDLRGRTVCYYKRWYETIDSLAAKFPEAARHLYDTGSPFKRADGSSMTEVVKYYGKDKATLFCPDKNVELASAPNPVKRCPVFIAERTKWDEESRGQFDQMVWVQLARARMALYAMEAADQALNAPLVLPEDVNQVAMGSRQVIRTRNPQGVGRLALDVPTAAFAENALLQQEERLAARYPEGMTGNIDASVITGQGINALLSTVNTQVRVAQELVGQAIEDAVSYCFELDQKIWPEVEKTTEGKAHGAPFSERYKPSKDIKNDYTVKASYGFSAGMDANRALVWALQLQAAGGLSRDTLMRLMGDTRGINPTQEQERIDVESLEEALKQGLMAYASQIPALAQQGMDPVRGLLQIATAIEDRQKGNTIHEAVLKAFEPTPEEQAAAEQAAQDPLAALMGGGAAGAPGAPAAGPEGPQDLQMMLAGLTSAGNPNVQASVSRMQPTAS